MAPPDDALDRVLAALGAYSVRARGLLDRYGRWLAEEAIPAGGLGPHEAERIVDRHLADSVAFAFGFEQLPDQVIDIGSGVGLPGIPLAIAFPTRQFVLLDRSGRRCGLLRRALRVLGLNNCEVVEGDGERLDPALRWPGMTFRGSLPPERAVAVATHHLNTSGTAVLGLSRVRVSDVEVATLQTQELEITMRAVPNNVLDSPSWLLRMTRL